jgi:hypothetical protein
VVFERPNRGHHDAGIRAKARLAALDIDELLGAKVRTKAGLSHNKVSQLERRLGGHDRIAAMGDVGKWAPMHKRGIVLERLDQIGFQRIPQQHRHRPVRLQVTGTDGLLLSRVADDDVANAFLEIMKRRGQTENRHHL